MTSLFHTILYQPLFNLLVGIYNTLPGPDLGLAIVVLTLLIRVLFIPLSIKSLISQRAMSQIQPKLQELQTKHKDDKQALAQATMALYKENKVNPLSGCFPILIQLPIIFYLYRVIATVNGDVFPDLYPFVENPGVLNHIAFGFLNLSAKHNIALTLMVGVLQGAQSWLTVKLQKTSSQSAKDNPALKMTQQMVYFFPIMIAVISWGLPAGVVLYLLTTTAFSIFEQLYIRRRYV